MARMNAPDLDLAASLREALVAAEYTYDDVAELIGNTAHGALSRNETTPALRRTTGGSPIETLTRLFLLQAPVRVEQAERALPGLVDRLCNAGILEQSVSEVAARMDVRPYADHERDLWVLSDLTPGLDGAPNKVGSDHVLGISSASTSLAQLTIREPVERSLDLGTGCGVQALHLAEHSREVIATDVNKRALWMTNFNAALNLVSTSSTGGGTGSTGGGTGSTGGGTGSTGGGTGSTGGTIRTREGSFFEPVAGETFDLIATNPPFVISPATGERLVYRDSGLPGDRVVEDIVRAAPDFLNDNGWCQILANWVIATATPWDERLATWLDGRCDVLVVQREVVDPATYVELWLKDAGLHGSAGYAQRYDTWLSWFDEQGIEAVGFGWINLRKVSTLRDGSSLASSGQSKPTSAVKTEFLDWPYDVEQPIASALRDWADHTVVGPGSVLLRREDVQQESVGLPGEADPEAVVLRQKAGLRRARTVDTVEAALVGACDGDLTVGQILDAVAQLLEVDPAETRATYLPATQELADQGFLVSP